MEVFGNALAAVMDFLPLPLLSVIFSPEISQCEWSECLFRKECSDGESLVSSALCPSLACAAPCVADTPAAHGHFGCHRAGKKMRILCSFLQQIMGSSYFMETDGDESTLRVCR